MRTKILLKILMDSSKVVSMSSLVDQMNLSESSIRNLIRDSNKAGLKHGFRIELARGEGYYLLKTDKVQLDWFLNAEEQKEGDVYNAKQRLKILLFNIFQMKGYFTSEQLSEKLEVSRATIIRDLKKIAAILNENHLLLEKKAHYGFQVSGEERNFRRAFAKYVLNSELYLEPANDFYTFSQSLHMENLTSLISQELQKSNLKMSDFALENILNHIKILMFRAASKNFVSANQKVVSVTDNRFKEVAITISQWIEDNYSLALPEIEIDLLSAHLSGKASVEHLQKKKRQLLLAEIDSILFVIDREFLTDFSKDTELKNSLLLHMFPLLNRLYNNLNLENPFIDEVYREYSNVFLIAFRFSEYIEEKYSFKLSIDEIGYLALHFAAHFEKIKRSNLEGYKKIVVICHTGGGSAQLLKIKLESMFPKAIIVTSSVNEIERVHDDSPDLFLTTVPFSKQDSNVPVIHIKHVLDELETTRIKQLLSLKAYRQPIPESSPYLLNLFSERFFYRDVTEDYETLLEIQAKHLIKEGYASEGYDSSVLERERRFSTIYKNGVAGPHALKLDGLKDMISVAIYKKPVKWQERKVQIVFLINLCPGHLFVHREISRLLLSIMEDDVIRERLVSVQNFEQFAEEIKKIILDRRDIFV